MAYLARRTGQALIVLAVAFTAATVRWKMASLRSCARDAVCCRLSLASVAMCHALIAATITTTSVVTPATCFALMLKCGPKDTGMCRTRPSSGGGSRRRPV